MEIFIRFSNGRVLNLSGLREVGILLNRKMCLYFEESSTYVLYDDADQLDFFFSTCKGVNLCPAQDEVKKGAIVDLQQWYNHRQQEEVSSEYTAV